MELWAAFIFAVILNFCILSSGKDVSVPRSCNCISLDGNSHFSFSKQSWQVKMYASTLLFHKKLLPKLSISGKLFSYLTNPLGEHHQGSDRWSKGRVAFRFQGAEIHCQSKHSHRVRSGRDLTWHFRFKWSSSQNLARIVKIPPSHILQTNLSHENISFISL